MVNKVFAVQVDNGDVDAEVPGWTDCQRSVMTIRDLLLIATDRGTAGLLALVLLSDGVQYAADHR